MAKINTIRQKAKDIFREYEILYTIINGMTAYFKDDFEERKDMIDELDKDGLRNFIRDIRSEILYLRNLYGLRVNNSVLVDFWDKVQALNWPPGKILYLHKYVLKHWFKRYNISLQAFNNFPEHAKIGIDPGILRKKRGDGINVFILEAILFEDMCSLFNLAKMQYESIDKEQDSKIKWKTFCSIMRATIIASFNFIESYLNGLAIDYYILNEEKLDEKTKSLLTDWDFDKDRPRYTSLRQKMLQYPRLILNLEYPPLQESNCPELIFLIENAKFLRDSIVHPSPNPNLETQRDNEFLNPNFEDVVNIIDNIILFVRKVERLIHKNYDKIDWFFDRGSDGFFPNDAFK